MKKDKYVIMTIGRTHSGKSTFGEDIKKSLRGSVLIQTDNIAEFLVDHFPKKMYTGDESNGDFKKPALKLSIFNIIRNHAISIGHKNVIFSNSNLYRDFRKENIDFFKENGYKIIGVYLNFHGSFLKKRIRESSRDNSKLKTNDFEKLVDLQRNIIDIPKESEFHYFYEVKKEEDLEKIKKKILRKIKGDKKKKIEVQKKKTKK